MAAGVVYPLLVEQLPEVASKLEQALRRRGEHRLAGAVVSVRIYDLCGCPSSSCGSFYTGLRPDGGFGPGHRNVVLAPAVGAMVLDVVDDVIRYVELIDRPAVHAALRTAESTRSEA
jgi:hypothetical protein